MMAKDLAQRPPSAVAVEEELRAWTSGDTVLPLDRREDPWYVQAVSALQTTEPSADYSLPGMSVPEVDLSSEIKGGLTSWSMQTKMLLLAVSLVLGGVALLTMLILLWAWRS